MDVLQTFLAYAREFEKTYADDDWGRLEKFFTDDAIYEVRGESYHCRLEGTDAIFRGIKKSLDGFDRRMTERTIEVVKPPAVDGDRLEVSWVVTYRRGDSPPARAEATTQARFEGDRIAELVDIYPPQQGLAFKAWVIQYAPDCNPSYD